MAEIRQKIISCSQGHYYDANHYDKCPYCNSGSFSHTIDPFSDKTVRETLDQTGEDTVLPDNDNNGRIRRTTDPDSRDRMSDRMGKTQYVDDSIRPGAPAPVVGWLVAVAGPCRGTDYRIHTGYNYIGRERGDICIRGDNAISAERDANVTYVPQTRQFYIAHELGKNVLLVNGAPVIGGSTLLKSFDRITIGTTELVFVCLCGDQFSWSGEGQGNA